MTSGWNSGSDREAILRRVAIVLSSLPAPMAAKLLGSIGPESKQAVRRTMSALTDVDPLERQRAIQAFKVTLERQPESASSTATTDDDLQIRSSASTRSELPGSRIVPNAAVSHPVQRSPLSFLSDVEDRTLARLLTAEHPQTIAFVLASVSPQQAARVLPQLGARLQQETMSRIGRLGEIPETAVAEVAEHFHSRLREQAPSERHALGRQALDAILAAMPSPDATQTDNDAQHNVTSSNTRDRRHVVGARSATTTGRDERQHNPNAMERSAVELTHRLRVAEATWPESLMPDQTSQPSDGISDEVMDASREPASRKRSHQAHNAINRSSDRETAGATARFYSTDAIHQHLIGLSPTELCQALGKVDTRDAMLALCGLPVDVADAALSALPRTQARAVRIKMNTLGSLHLREIDRAKEKVAEASLAKLPPVSTPASMAA